MAHSRADFRTMFVIAVGIAACGRPDATPGAQQEFDSAGTTDTAMVTGEWPADLGATLVVPSDTENLAVVLYPVAPETLSAARASLTLVSSGGDTVRRHMGLGVHDSLHCGDAPIVRLARPAPLSWSIGLQSVAAIPLRTDSMDALSAADSAFYSADMARLASAVNAQQASRFTGLTFTLVTLRRFRLDAREVAVAQVVRRVNQEADPREERTMIVAERGRASAEPFTAMYSGRSDGNEDNTDHFDLLAALRTTRGTLLVLARERPAGTTFAILERDAAGTWTVKWTRSIAC